MKRIYHTWDKWECYPAGFYESGTDKPEPETMYCDFLSDIPKFEKAMARILKEWPKSCEHYLSNENMNRIAWMGQAAACIALNIPACYRGGFNFLTQKQQDAANKSALKYINKWLKARGEKPMKMEDAQSKTEMNLY